MKNPGWNMPKRILSLEQQEKNRQRAKAWYAANKERACANVSKWQSENKEKVSEYKLRHAEANRQSINQRSSEYRKNNPDKRIVWEHARRSRKAACGGRLSLDIAERLMTLQKGCCAACRVDLAAAGKHLDHIIPLSAGGANADENMQLLCPGCNVRKGAKHPVDFMQQRGYLL